jgi:hypothetical protein
MIWTPWAVRLRMSGVGSEKCPQMFSIDYVNGYICMAITPFEIEPLYWCGYERKLIWAERLPCTTYGSDLIIIINK